MLAPFVSKSGARRAYLAILFAKKYGSLGWRQWPFLFGCIFYSLPPHSAMP